jgi:3-deoxy-7-phosphoheptulonate synthase
VSPAALAERYPLDRRGAELVAARRREIAAALAGDDDRLVVVVGPCSIHDPVAALDYAERLAEVAWAHADDLIVVMRVYVEKPRTVAGWKGLTNDPGLDGSFDVNEGLRCARELLLEVTRLGLPSATEFLGTLVGPFYSDLVSLGMIGARTVESQVHRELASGLPMPVGFKNRTDGDVNVAVDAIRAARLPHHIPALTPGGSPAVIGTSGNNRTHVVLRGGTRGPNFSSADVAAALGLLRRYGLPPHVMVDCGHANSGKDPSRQPVVASCLAARVREGDRAISGVMLESNLTGGSQEASARPLVYGQSITDACMSWKATVPVLDELALAAKARRRLKSCFPSGALEQVSP